MYTYLKAARYYWWCGVFILLAVMLMLALPTSAQAEVVTEHVPYLTQDLPLNNNVSGNITATDKEHWYTVTTTQDGKLTIKLEGNVNTLGTLRLYDINGYVEIRNIGVEGRDPGSVDVHLAPGTYFVKVERRDREWPYRLSSTFEATTAEVPNDPEPNDIYQLASGMDLNTQVTGRLGYYTDGYIDNTDWWQVTTTEDGLLQIDLEAVNGAKAGAKGTLRLYGVNSTVKLAEKSFDYNQTTTASVAYNLMPATYYIQVERTAGVWGYELNNSFTAAAYANDLDSNDDFTSAQSLALGGSSTGHLGYHYYNTVDTQDWWKITTTQDGVLKVDVQGTDAARGSFTLHNNYKQNLGKVDLGVNNLPLEGSVERELKAGTYYVLVQHSGNSWSYKISNRFTPQTVAGEHPGAGAKTLPLNSGSSGKIDENNTEDWWKVTTDADGLLEITFESNVETDTSFRLFDQNGTNALAGSGYWGTKGATINRNLQPGTYYVQLSGNARKPFSYTLTSSYTKAPLASDPEPNDIKEVASVLPLGGSVTGHIGYYRDNYTDTMDWWQVTTDADGLLEIKFESNVETSTWFNLYDQNGTNVLAGTHYSDTKGATINRNLQPGTYYVRLSGYANRPFSYTLSSSLTKAPLADDPDTNDIKEAASVLPLGGSVTGHIGYYRDNYTDTMDWWQVTTDADGLLEIKFESNVETSTWFNLYDQNGTNVLAGTHYSDTKGATINRNLQPGTYYVRLSGYASRLFSYTLSSSFTKAPLANDPEPNFHLTQAGTMTLDKAVTGHFGYYTNYFADTKDWWKVHIPQAGTLTVNMMPTAKPSCRIGIYGSDGTTRLNYVSTGDEYLKPSQVEAKITDPGDYYILIERSSDRAFSYYLTASLTTETVGSPAIKAVYPLHGATVQADFGEVELAVLATFNKKIKASSLLESGAFKLLDSSGNLVSSTVSYQGTIACLIPDFSPEKGTYTAVISGAVEDESGTPLGSDYRWTFTVGDYDQDPEIIPVAQVTLDQTTLELTEKATGQLSANIYPVNAHNQAIQWHSSNSLVAEVDQNGLVTALAPGETVITVTTIDGGKTATCMVTVTDKPSTATPVTGVTLDMNSLELTRDAGYNLTATVQPANADNKAVSWKSSNAKVATVDENGSVLAIGPGTATITVTTIDGNKTAICTVTVIATPVWTVSLNKNTMELTAGGAEQLIATVMPAHADNKAVTWQSSNNRVATVHQNGEVTAIAPGETVITVTTIDGNKTATCTVTVTKKSDANRAPEAKNVTVTGEYTVGGILTGSYDFYDADNDEEYGSTYRWLRSATFEGDYTAIPGATGKKYTATSADAGKYLKFEVTPRAGQGIKDGQPQTSPPVYIWKDTGSTEDYKVWPEMVTEDVYKTWRINLSAPVDPSTLGGAVYVQDATGRTLHQELGVTGDHTSLLLFAPSEGYRLNSLYTLFIEKTLCSNTGTPLKEPIKMYFSVYEEEEPGEPTDPNELDPIFVDHFNGTCNNPEVLTSKYYAQNAASTNKISWVGGKSGQAVHLDDMDSYVGYSSSILNPTEGTIRFYWKPDADLYNTYSQPHDSWKNHDSSETRFEGMLLDTIGYIGTYSGSFSLDIRFSNEENNYDTSVTFLTWDGTNWSYTGYETPDYFRWDSNTWYDMAITWNEKEGKNKLYIDGQLKSEIDFNTPMDTQENFFLGHCPWIYEGMAYYPYGPHSMQGAYDELKVYDQALDFKQHAEPVIPTGDYQVNWLTHAGFDFSAGEFYGEDVYPEDYETLDGDIIAWEPFSGEGWGTNQIWLRTLVEDDRNAIADLGPIALDTVNNAKSVTFPAEAPALKVGHVYVMQCKDGYVKFKALEVVADEDWKVKVEWAYSKSGYFNIMEC